MGTIRKEQKITFEIKDQNPLENIFDNSNNSYLAIRNVSWNKQDPKLEIRRWYINKEDNETPSKGITFYTEEGPHQLTHLLLKLGYGDLDTIDKIITFCISGTQAPTPCIIPLLLTLSIENVI